jgi:nicotinate phosphoribosyltransferase
MIIDSLLDTDMYKISMLRVFFHHFPNIQAKYIFKCRNKDVKFNKDMLNNIQKEVDHLCNLRFTDEEVDYIGSLYYMKDAKGFLEFLRMFKLNKKYISINLTPENKLEIIAEGPIWQASMFEIYILAIVNEIYFRYTALYKQILVEQGSLRLEEKIDLVNREKFLFSDFGTRRRFSKSWQDFIVKFLRDECPTFTGTSNIELAMKYNVTPIGTMAHEYICLGQALDEITIEKSQSYMLQKWAEEYRGDLGIALSDTLGFEYFKLDFDKYFGNLFSGIRHDSGDPIEWGKKAIEHYKKLGIDPKTKSLVFSDNLNFEKAAMIHNIFKDHAKISFGIGTNLTNDLGVDPLNIVFKMVEANGKPVAKLSDSEGKIMCENESYINYLKSVIKNRLEK